jgi:hypothetical protein
LGKCCEIITALDMAVLVEHDLVEVGVVKPVDERSRKRNDGRAKAEHRCRGDVV